MPDVLIYIVLVIVLLALLALAHKYHIDTKDTIKELSKDRKLYQRMAWQEIEARESFLKQQSLLVAKNESTLKDLVSHILDFKEFIKTNNSFDEKSKKSILKKLEFINSYSNVVKEKDQKSLRNGSPPGIERRF